ncbi:hypothetical protein LELG_00789 [Lodderomyces elongisporus NRRL YB-4239]|uniref:Probable 26S proteasome regulatory subunit p27 n=1 Tax=Lodderomyces elongisporus (strain ATCC 11503 / CBS 2605 / JCM 1781 / NBRC 1676 / NRRL YB-4239) TaxID=379508 RepID=A5DTV3_LODEL|nr:hypothetical protein LELG_00789 [Lodderomyces elongisporus NRRL YB-4239]
MTVDDHDVSGFQGLMSSLNLDPTQFKQYDPLLFPQFTFQQLLNLKLEIESQLSILGNLLSQKYGADMNTPLVSPDGFPRSDIDVVTIRLLRVQIIRLRNDYKDVLKVLENKMEEEFKRLQAEEPESAKLDATKESHQKQGEMAGSALEHTYTPFAIVKEVIAGGPAEAAGLEEEDKIVLFDGDIHSLNNESLQRLVERVRRKNGLNILMKVQRREKSINLTLRPTDQWGGKGLLGCRIVPINS